MPLAGYKPEHRVIQLAGGNSFEVRGLSLTDLSVLIREHMPDLDAVFDLFGHMDVVKPEDLQPLITAAVSQMPGLAANVIALAAGEGDASDAAKLSGPIQVRALIEIGEMTFAEVGGVGKAWEMVTGLLKMSKKNARLTGQVAEAVKRVKARSHASTTASAAM